VDPHSRPVRSTAASRLNANKRTKRAASAEVVFGRAGSGHPEGYGTASEGIAMVDGNISELEFLQSAQSNIATVPGSGDAGNQRDELHRTPAVGHLVTLRSFRHRLS
jgi:hypothetical protein